MLKYAAVLSLLLLLLPVFVLSQTTKQENNSMIVEAVTRWQPNSGPERFILLKKKNDDGSIVVIDSMVILSINHHYEFVVFEDNLYEYYLSYTQWGSPIPYIIKRKITEKGFVFEDRLVLDSLNQRVCNCIFWPDVAKIKCNSVYVVVDLTTLTVSAILPEEYDEDDPKR